ncbi:MAG: 3'-5' exonuclease, partial [Syntrophomonadaceae bacterium]|nr:3'-5' exonuclease [Syntrophomonadaceae bacterium]
RVLSIHKSKGLEFPVVYLVGTGRRFNLRSLDAPLLAHRELGVGPMRVDVQRSVQYPTLAYRAIRHRLLMETLAEEMRLLYVAVTRARERLVLVGTVRDPENSLRGWREVVAVDGADGPSPAAPGAPLPAGLRAQARSFLEWLGPALAALDAERPGSVQWPQVGPAPGERALFEVRCAVVPAMERSEQEGSARQEPVMPVAGDPERVAFRLGWRYPWAVLARRPAKVSVTEVKRAAEPGDRPQEAWRPAGECLPHLGGRPRFLQEEAGLSAVEVGIAMHTVMQHLELGGRLDADGIAGQVARMVAREILTPHQAQAVDREAIARFFAGELGQRLRRAGKVWRELPFTLRLPARELYPEPEAEGEHVVLQGVIDCLLEDEEGLVLIDFKSDRLTGGMEALAGRYRTQIGLYARAVTAITGRPLQAAYLYSFAGGASWRVQPGSEVAGGRGEGIE